MRPDRENVSRRAGGDELPLISYVQGFWSAHNAMFMQARTPLKNLAGDGSQHLQKLMAECERKPRQDFGIIIRDYFYELPSLPNPKAN